MSPPPMTGSVPIGQPLSGLLDKLRWTPEICNARNAFAVSGSDLFVAKQVATAREAATRTWLIGRYPPKGMGPCRCRIGGQRSPWRIAEHLLPRTWQTALTRRAGKTQIELVVELCEDSCHARFAPRWIDRGVNTRATGRVTVSRPVGGILSTPWVGVGWPSI